VKFAANAVRRIGNALQSPTWEWSAFFHWKARAWAGRLRQSLPDDANPLSEVHRCIDFSCVPETERPLWQAHVKALIQYHPKPYPGRVTLFRSPVHALFCSFDPGFGWGALASEGVTVRIIPGAHETIMKEPNVRHLAGELNACLLANTPTPQRPASC
jgi:hypothetical protein